MGDLLLWLRSVKADSILPVLWGDERQFCHSLQPCQEAPQALLPLWGLLQKAVQGATAPLSAYEDLPPLPHE